MPRLFTLTVLALLAAPAWAADFVITRSKHTDAAKVMGRDQAAQDSTEVTWMAKDRMRVEEGDRVTIVRTDLKKLFMLDLKAKTYTAVDLPFDMKKYVPAELAQMIEPMMAQMKTTVTPTTETKKVKDWNATRYTVAMTGPMGASFTQEMWVTKDVAVDPAALKAMQETLMSVSMMAAPMAAEMKKLDGLVLVLERTQKVMGAEIKSKEEVTAIEQKEPAAGLYDLPEGFTEKPFDPMSDPSMKGGMGGMRGGMGPKGAPPAGGKGG
ncbi:MAG: DUF4412 domain-containing protein [Planctomycetes bacterium]|nr:DUF4412 domain-containing protein [Planctomycetota bacterium]